MNRARLATAVLLSLLSAACVSTPAGRDDAAVDAAVAHAGIGAPRLPSGGEGYLDASWFTEPLTPERAVQGALLNNPRVRGELARLDEAQAERVQAGLLRNPLLSLTALRPEGGGRFELDYGLMLSLFDLVSRSGRTAVADAAQRRVEAEVVGQLIAIAQDTQAAYYDALIAEAKLRVRREQQAVDGDVLRLSQRQAGQGAVLATEVLQQQALTSMQAHEVQVAEAGLIQARAMLAQQMGLSSAAPLQLPDAMPAFAVPGLAAPALQALATAHRPDLMAAAASEDQARAEGRLQSSGLRATEPMLGPAGMRETGGMSLYGLGVEILLPVFDTGQSRRALANAKITQAGFAAEGVWRRVPLEVERALATLLAADIAVTHADHHLAQQQQLERLARRTYALGIAGRASYLQASRARLDAAMQQLDARQARWAAMVALERATGTAALATNGASP